MPITWSSIRPPTRSIRRVSWRPTGATFADDFHWHIEFLPIVERVSRSYSIKEVYFNALMPEQAAERLRQLDPNA